MICPSILGTLNDYDTLTAEQSAELDRLVESSRVALFVEVRRWLTRRVMPEHLAREVDRLVNAVGLPEHIARRIAGRAAVLADRSRGTSPYCYSL